MADAPTAQTSPYRIIETFHEGKWNEQLQRVVEGTTVRALWLATRAVVVVFVPNTDDLVSTADTLIRHQGDQLDRLQAAGA